jgi:hypothetical protein
MRTLVAAVGMSALGLIQTSANSFDHLVYTGDQGHRDNEANDFAVLTRLFHREPDRERHLIMAHLATLDVAAGANHFEPSQIAQSLVCARDRPIDCV